MKVDIDDDLCDRLETRAETVGLDSAEAYSVFVLETVVDELETQDKNTDVTDRLKDLGYLE